MPNNRNVLNLRAHTCRIVLSPGCYFQIKMLILSCLGNRLFSPENIAYCRIKEHVATPVTRPLRFRPTIQDDGGDIIYEYV